MKRRCAEKIVGKATGGFALTERPICHTKLLLGKCQCAIRVRLQRTVHVKQDSDRCVKNLVHLQNQLPNHFLARGGFGQIPCELIKGYCSLLAPALGLFLSAYSRDQLPQHDSNNEIEAKQDAVLQLGDDEGKLRRQKEKIPRHCAQCTSEQHRSASHL